MINDKEYRLALIKRYLDAETSVEEEAILLDYYSGNDADEDEAAVARLILATCPQDLGDKVSAAETFDSMVRKGSRRRLIWITAAATFAIAASAALFMVLWKPEEKQSPMFDIIQSMSTMAEFGRVKDIRSEQIDDMIFITMTIDDGKQVSYVMIRNDANGVLSYIPANKK